MDHSEGDESAKPEEESMFWRVLPAAVGSFIEWYDFAMYSYTSSYITENYFANGRGGSLGTWAGFAITFAVRPLGGTFFGWLADRFGRKPAMQLTILLMLITTVLQGCLPTFRSSGESWGWFGLVALLILRALQGLSAGGELSTAAVYISEVSEKENLGFNLSWISVGGTYGAWFIASLVIFAFESSISSEDMLNWGWRLPFFTTLIPGIMIIFFRQHLRETTDFEVLLQAEVEKQSKGDVEEGQKGVEATAGPLQEVLANHKLALLIGSLGTAGIGAIWYVLPVYGMQFIKEFNDLPGGAWTFSGSLTFLVPTILAPFVGRLIDRIGVGKVFTASIVLGGIITPVPLFYWWAHVPAEHALTVVFISPLILGVLQSLTTSVFLWVVEMFPVRVRVTGVSIAYNIGIGIFGGMGPIISDAGNRVISPRSLVSAPAAFTLLVGVVSFIGIIAGRMLANRGLLQLTHIRHSPY